jgi:hypothetical protein
MTSESSHVRLLSCVGPSGDCGIGRHVERLGSKDAPLDPPVECPSNTNISRPLQTAGTRQPDTGAFGMGVQESALGS